jgi:hypothetical protein
MRRIPILLLLAFLCHAARAGATTLTFDNIIVSAGQYTAIPNGYGGLNWSNMLVLNPNAAPYLGSGYANGAVTGNIAFNGGGNEGDAFEVNALSTFTFNSAYLTGALRNGLNIEVKGYNNGSLLYDTTVIVNSYAPTLFTFDYVGVDQLRFITSGGTFAGYPSFGNGAEFSMDNFTLNEAVSSVPEPATLLLLGTGLVGVMRRRGALR